MPIDFSDMLDDDDDVVLHPRDIFFTLSREPNFSFPRDIQTEVLNHWFKARNNPDSVIKLNVGSGKTLVGLLILQSSLNENKGPALYVCPDKQLTQQVIVEAEALGIEVTDDPRDSGYLAGEKVCVVNVYKLFNGKSVFGVGSIRIKIGTLVVDDAHACVSTITEQFRVNLGNSHDAYKEILSLLSEDLKGYNEAKFLDVNASDPQAFIEVPFWSWHANASSILEILHKYREDEQLRFQYPLVKELLSECRCIIGGQYLEIEPYFPATDLIQSFRRAERRVYMTATLADDSLILTHFAAQKDALTKPIVPSSSQSMGERMILMPQELNPDISASDIRELLKEVSLKENVVVIVPSETAAQDWDAAADQLLIGDRVAQGIENLRNGHIGLTILVNRYDGIDLPRSACRVLVLVDLPEVSSYSDLLDSQVLSGTTANLRRQVERIEQGMGRGVRSNEDYCAVLLLGAKLTSRLRSPEGQALLTPSTKAQLDLSRKIAKRLGTPSLDDIKGVLMQCLNRDPDWIKVSKKVLVGIKADDELRVDWAKVALKESFDLARANQYQDALVVLDKAIDSSHERHLKAWLLSRKAAFQHVLDADGAQKTLLAAHKIEPSVLKPMQGVTYKLLSPSTEQQAITLIRNHESRFIDATQMRLFSDELCSDLVFKPNTSEKFEAAINDLAFFLGISGQRPEKEYREGPDNLWGLPNGSFLVIECKNGIESDSGIIKKDAGQLGQSMSWFTKRYPASTASPVIIHPERTLGQAASSVQGMRVIDKNGLSKLTKNLRSFVRELASPDVSSNTTEIVKRLSQYELSADAFVNAFSTTVKG